MYKFDTFSSLNQVYKQCENMCQNNVVLVNTNVSPHLVFETIMIFRHKTILQLSGHKDGSWLSGKRRYHKPSTVVPYRTSRQVKGAVLCGNRGGVWLREAPKRLSQVWYFLPLETHRI